MTGSSETLAALADEMWEDLLAREPYHAAKWNRRIDHLPPNDLATVEAVAARARTRLVSLERLDTSGLGREKRLTAGYLAHILHGDIDHSQHWWSTFGVTPCNIAFFSTTASLVFGTFQFDTREDGERYLQLIHDFASAIDAEHARLVAQADRGWHVPRPALPNVRTTLDGLSKSVPIALIPREQRCTDSILRDRIERAVDSQIRPAFARLIAELSSTYEAAAPETVGMSQYPGGLEAYRILIRSHLGEAAQPEAIHTIGLSEVAKLSQEMADFRANAFGWNGDEASFHAQLRNDSRSKVGSPEALEAIYRRHLARMQAIFPEIVGRIPKAPPDIARLSSELEVGMTFGYYEAGQREGEPGIYHYSGYGLGERLQLGAASLIFHELVPGHHVQVARQVENHALPAIRRGLFSPSAFVEGWAEYSAGIGEEMGLYDDPYDMYGWLSHQRFIAQRLVVDTGLNAMEWTLDRARAYMSANTLEGATQVASETLRYATDIPGQALAYRMGFRKFRELRDRAKARLGERFKLPAFHEAILSEGALPFEVLADSLDEWASEVETPTANR